MHGKSITLVFTNEDYTKTYKITKVNNDLSINDVKLTFDYDMVLTQAQQDMLNLRLQYNQELNFAKFCVIFGTNLPDDFEEEIYGGDNYADFYEQIIYNFYVDHVTIVNGDIFTYNSDDGITCQPLNTHTNFTHNGDNEMFNNLVGSRIA